MVAVGVFLSTMDSSMINVALPSIMRSFGATLPQAEWVVLMYLLTITVSLLFWGRMADGVGKGRVYLLGMLVFTAGSLACFLSATLGQLIVFRFFQALGAAMMMATGPAIIKMTFPVGQLGMALGFIGVATSVGLMSGPVISGFLLHAFSWRSIFLVTVPISLGFFLLGWIFLLPYLQRIPGHGKNNVSFDWLGMILWTMMVALAVLLSTHHTGVPAQILLVEGGFFLLFFALFLRVESTHRFPLFPFALFSKRSYGIAILCAALSFTVLFVVLILMPFYLDYILELSTKQIGFVMMAVPVAVFVVSPLSGFLYDRIGARLLTTSGLALCTCSLLFLCFLSPESSVLSVAWSLIFLGAGQALFLSPNSAAVLDKIRADQTGVSSGMLATARNFGMLAGVSLGGLFFGLIFSNLSGGLDLIHFQPDQVHNFIDALQATFSLTALLSLFAAVLSSLRGE